MLGRQWRYDFFIIWGNGLAYSEEIIKMIEQEENFEILMTYKYKPRNMRRFVKNVYRCDYVPSVHLRTKTNYLKKVDKCVLFIFIKNYNPDERIYGEGYFSVLESYNIKNFKEKVRNKYNRKVSGKRTEEHVIHGSDNENQTLYMLKYLGFDEGFAVFNDNKYLISYPSHIGKYAEYEIKKIAIDKMYARIIFEGKGKEVSISETPQYKAIQGAWKEYSNYVESNRGSFLCDYYSEKKLATLANEFSYLKNKNDSYIVVKKWKDGYLVLDGLHRTSILKLQGRKEICVVEVIGERERYVEFK